MKSTFALTSPYILQYGAIGTKDTFIDNAAIIAMQGMLCGMNDWNETLLAHSAYEMAKAMWDEHTKRNPVELSPSGYVAEVPNHCDRIVWKGKYYYLPALEKVK